MKKLILGIAFVVIFFAALILVYIFGGRYCGWAKAHLDLWRGDDRIIVVGLPPFWEEEATRIYAEKYHIQRVRIALCIVSPWAEGYEEGYNSVAIPAIQSKHPKRVLAEAERDSIQEYLRIHKPEGHIKDYCELKLRQLENQ